MSSVDSLVLICNLADRLVATEIDLGEGLRFVDAGKHPGGNKYMQCCLLCAAINYADFSEIVALVASAPWRRRESVLLMRLPEQHMRPECWGFDGARYFGSVSTDFIELLPSVPS